MGRTPRGHRARVLVGRVWRVGALGEERSDGFGTVLLFISLRCLKIPAVVLEWNAFVVEQDVESAFFSRESLSRCLDG